MYPGSEVEVSVDLKQKCILTRDDQGYFDELELENIRFLVQFRTCSGGPCWPGPLLVALLEPYSNSTCTLLETYSNCTRTLLVDKRLLVEKYFITWGETMEGTELKSNSPSPTVSHCSKSSCESSINVYSSYVRSICTIWSKNGDLEGVRGTPSGSDWVSITAVCTSGLCNGQPLHNVNGVV